MYDVACPCFLKNNNCNGGFGEINLGSFTGVANGSVDLGDIDGEGFSGDYV